MRLLELNSHGEFSLTKDFVSNEVPVYAILSHTWGPDTTEVTYRDLIDGTGKDKVGYEKIRFCGEQASRDGLHNFWVDTCCINKSSSTELTEAINSMYRWYSRASKCYVYLTDVSTDNHIDLSLQQWEAAFENSRWFTRGWTLQELIAPPLVEFFCRNGNLLGDKKSLERQLHKITAIPVSALQCNHLSKFSFDERRSWAQTRETRREEDKAYCLLGVLGISMGVIYGEGEENAFRRLNREWQFQLYEQHGSVHRMVSWPISSLFTGCSDLLSLIQNASIGIYRPLYADNSSRERLLPNSQDGQARNYPFFRRKRSFSSLATAFLIIVVIAAFVVSLSLRFLSRDLSWPVSLPVRQIAACECEVSIFITHQNEHNDLYMRTFYHEGSHWSSTEPINTTIYPAANTPLTSVCWRWEDYFVREN